MYLENCRKVLNVEILLDFCQQGCVKLWGVLYLYLCGLPYPCALVYLPYFCGAHTRLAHTDCEHTTHSFS